MSRGPVSLLVVCTGNTCRSVMAAVMLEHLAAESGVRLDVSSAGTHAVEAVPISARTLSALQTIPELEPSLPKARAHRSSQLAPEQLEDADLVVAMETAHVRFVRTRHPEAATKTAMFRTLVRELPRGDDPLEMRIARLGLENADLDAADDVADPFGHDDGVYLRCAADLWALCAELVNLL